LWDKRFESTETFKAALEKGYLNPTGNNTSPFSRYNGQPGLVDPDPLSGVYSNASNQFKTKLETQLREYKDNNFINASGISMWGLATITAVCANDNSLNCFTTNGGDNKAFDTLTMCTGDLDMAWRTFRQLYLDIKREIVYAHINAACAGQPGNVTAATLVNARHQVHFSDAKELLQLHGVNLPTTQAQANALQQQTQVDNAAYYVSNCQAYASQWWRQMKPCNYNSADSAVIMPRLIQVCIEGSDIAHPLGSSTVKPGSTYPFKSFYDVFMHYADSAKKTFNTAACNVYLINAPAPYDKPAMNANAEVWAKPDSCLCNRFNQLYTKYQQQPSGFTSFSAYIAGKFGATMPETDLQTILQLCNGTSTCNYLPKPIKIPVALQCGNELACIDCDQMAQTYAQFLKDFPNAHRTSNNTTAVQTYYTLFTNYFNAKFGFNKSYQDYMQFLQTCNIFTYQPSTTTTNLQGVALGTGTGHTDASQVSSDTLQAVAAQFNTLYPNVGPWNLVTKKVKRILYPTLEYLLGCAGISGYGTAQRTVNPPEWKGSGLKDNAYASGWFRNNLTFVNFNVREIPSTAIVDSVNLKMSPVLTAPFNPGIYWADITTAWDTSLTCGQLASSYYGTQVATYTPMYHYTSPQGNLVYTYNCLNQYTGYFKFPWFYLGNGLHSILNPTTTNSNDQTFIGTNNPIAQSDAEAKPRLEVWLRSDTLYSCKDFIVTYFNDRLKTNLTYDQLVQVYQQTTGTALPINCGTSPVNAQLCGRTEPIFPEIETDEIDNCSDSTFFAVSKGTELYLEYKKRINDAFDSSYRTKCMQAYQFETFTVTHDVSEYHYTLYYYDQAGNLVKTVPPEGVQPNFNLLWLDSVKVARSNGTVKVPDHGLLTQYRYNTLNAVTVQHTPDAGRSNFWYDRLARLAVSQNAKQKAASTGELNSKYSYTLYDVLGRITEVGQIANAGTVPITDSITRRENLLATWISNSAAKKEQITQTVYDTEYAAFTGLANAPLVQRNLRNRVAYTTITVGNNPAQYNQASFYTYDVHGNVDTLVQDYGSSAFTAVVNVMNANGNRFKKMVYQYDLISGKVNHVAYQPRQADQFYHRYAYDADNRLVLAETSADSLNWERDARYQYYKHGPLARTILGEQQVQGLDYAYTLKGWLKGLNSSALNADFDMGNDGKTGTQNQYIGRDAVGFNLNYFTGDYAAISNANVFGGTSGFLGTAYRPLYNGNISSMAVNIRQFNNPLLYNHTYDQLNRLKAMDAYNGLNQSTNSWSGLTLLPDYRERVTYDANGNILTYTRNATGAANTIAMDNLAYNYNRNGGRLLNNRLNFIGDAIAANRYTVDIDNQSTGNYVYDEIGNLTKDNAEKITNIIWNVYGKIQEIQKTATTANPVTNIQYTYDAAGNRISKRVAKSGTTTIEFTWYVRDAQGNVMATYNSTGTGTTMSAYSLQARELYLYGSSRIGVLNKTINMKVTPVLSDTMNHYRGLRHYELSNHLGNVLATISDKKIGVSGNSVAIDYYNADIVTAQDYYPFGMMMPGRNYNASGVSDYRFGFNGKENDNEVKGEGSQQDYGMRIYDPRIGKFLSVDPIASKYPELTPYQFASNSPIASIDLDGLEGLVATGMPQPFSNNSRPVGMIFTAEEAAKINRNATIAAFKGVFSDPLPKKFIDHYANSNGADYKLTRSEAFSLNVEKTGIKGIAQADVDRFNEMTSSIRTRVRRGNKTIESKYTILYLDSYNIQGAANVGGTLGRFTIQLQGKLTINSSDKTWTFEGKMRYFDTYDFKTSPVGENDLHRSSWGDFQTGFAGKFLPGTGFNVYSDWFDVKQSSSDLYFDFFKGKSSESKQNRVSNEIQTSTENGSDNAVPKEIKEGKGG
jgi:RHS repeat-associated protein